MSRNSGMYWVCIVFATVCALLGKSDQVASYLAAALVISSMDKEK